MARKFFLSMLAVILVGTSSSAFATNSAAARKTERLMKLKGVSSSSSIDPNQTRKKIFKETKTSTGRAPLPQCTANDWECSSWSTCQATGYQVRTCTMKQSAVCTGGAQQPMYQACSSSSSSFDASAFSATLAEYIARAESNAEVMKGTRDSWKNNGPTSTAAQSIGTMYFSYTGSLARLKYYLTLSASRALTASELQDIVSVEKGMNSTIETYNRLVNSWN